ncbi:hypothetical protein [Pseudoalteromonas shioyasakiensis]|uniref:hypothetical protein n=1 Tax=Pseudoalteromonas shioyasakiensis TaxID=1190813 RepID=UPI0022B1D86D|nr:hypothetical protein [Pseudoalteromonas shioyasakiensis]MCZ4250104.1 hypothetical protein [Pseudoalteromonas shioyasakiensis]
MIRLCILMLIAILIFWFNIGLVRFDVISFEKAESNNYSLDDFQDNLNEFLSIHDIDLSAKVVDKGRSIEIKFPIIHGGERLNDKSYNLIRTYLNSINESDELKLSFINIEVKGEKLIKENSSSETNHLVGEVEPVLHWQNDSSNVKCSIKVNLGEKLHRFDDRYTVRNIENDELTKLKYFLDPEEHYRFLSKVEYKNSSVFPFHIKDYKINSLGFDLNGYRKNPKNFKAAIEVYIGELANVKVDEYYQLGSTVPSGKKTSDENFLKCKRMIAQLDHEKKMFLLGRIGLVKVMPETITLTKG